MPRTITTAPAQAAESVAQPAASTARVAGSAAPTVAAARTALPSSATATRSALREVAARYRRCERRSAAAVRKIVAPGFWPGSLYTGLLVAVFVLSALDRRLHLIPLLLQTVSYTTILVGKRRFKWLKKQFGPQGVHAPLLYRRLVVLSYVQFVAIFAIPLMGYLLGGHPWAWLPWFASLRASGVSAALAALNAGACAAVLTEQLRIWAAHRGAE